MTRNIHKSERGFILLYVVVAITLVAAIAFALNNPGVNQTNIASGELQRDQLRYITEAGMAHARLQLSPNDTCDAYTNVPSTPFGTGSYTANITPTEGSPVTVTATGTLATGAQHTLSQDAVKVYSTTATQTTTFQPGPEGDDTYIWDGAHKNTNFGATAIMELNNASAERVALLRFDVSAIPAGAAVGSATLELYLEGGSDLNNGVIDAHRVTQSWFEGEEDDNPPSAPGATYMDYDGTNAWANPGGDFDPAPVSTTTIPNLNQGWHQWDVSTLAAGGSQSEIANNGVLLRASGGNVDKIKFTSSDGNAAETPKLTITYTCECGQPCAADDNTFLLSTGGDAELGGLIFQDTDLVEYDRPGDSATLFLDSIAVGMSEEIDAVHVLADGHIILSTKDDTSFAGLTFKSEDLVNYDPVGNAATMFLEAEAHFQSKENVISVHILDNGNIVLSTDGGATLGGLSFSDKDLVEYDPVSGNASIFFDGDATTLSKKIQAVHIRGNGHIVLAADGDTTLGSLSFGPDQLIDYDPVADNAILYFDGETLFSSTDEKVRSVHIGAGSGGQVSAGGSQKLLFVVGTVSGPGMTAEELAHQALVESWGYTVEIIDDDASQAEFDAAAASNDVAYATNDITASRLGMKLVNATIGVVTSEVNLSDEFGMASTVGWESGTVVEINDNTHYITSPFATGVLTIFSASESLAYATGTLSPDLGQLASSSSGYGIVTLETGAAMYGGGTAAGRRVQLPWGGSPALGPNDLTADGLTILQRALEWGAGAGGATATGPIAHWKLDDSVGTTAIDSEGGHDGTLVNSPTWVAGRIGDALNFDGSNDYVDLTSDAELDDVFVGGATVMAWIQPGGWGEAGYGRIFDKSSSPSSTNDGWVIRMNVDNGGIINFGQGFTGGRGWWAIPNGSISLDTWQHIAVAYDSSSTANDPVIYVDGSPLLVTEKDTPSGDIRSDAPIDLRLGNYAGGTTHTFDGIIDDARIYDRILGAAEIADIAGGGGGGLHYLDEFNAVAYDGNDGTLEWTEDWQELSEGDGPTAGFLRVANDGNCTSTDCLRIGHLDSDVTQRMLRREADLSSSASWVLSYDYGTSGADRGFLHVEVSGDGGSNWSPLTSYDFDGGDVSGSESFDLTGFIASDTQIRFRLVNREDNPGVLEQIRGLMFIDDVKIEPSGGGGGGGGGGSCDGTFRDEFNAREYSNSDGTLLWATDWEETGESTDPTGGDIRIDDDTSDYQLQVRDDGQTVMREADLSTAGSATLSFDYRRENLSGSGDYVAVEVSYNGGSSWTELDRFAGTATDGSYISTDYLLDENLLSANTRIRFLTPGSGMSNSNRVYFDNVEIVCAP